MTTYFYQYSGPLEIYPLLVEGFESQRTGGTIVHQILGRTNPDVTLRPAGLRSGTLTLLFNVEADALTAANAFSDPDVFYLDSDERNVNMWFVVPEGQTIGFTLDSETRTHWHVTVPYQEVTL